MSSFLGAVNLTYKKEYGSLVAVLYKSNNVFLQIYTCSKLNSLTAYLMVPLIRELQVKFLSENFANSSADQPKTYLNDTLNWLGVLKTNLKGDTWEMDIMTKALSLVEEKIKQASEEVQGGV